MMKLRTLALGAVIAALGFGAGALAQSQLSSRTLTGSEVIELSYGGAQGQSLFSTVSQMRNAQGVTTTALTSGTVNLTTNTATLITTAALSGALTINTPAQPWDGEIFELANGSGSSNTGTATLTATGSQTVNGGAVATQANQASAEWRYVLSTNTWYRLR